MYEAGECSFNDADNANIPVDVWLTLTPVDEGVLDSAERGKGKWRLEAANYMPRKSVVHSEAYCVYSDKKEELEAIVRNKILPLYRSAVGIMEKMCSDPDGGSLYYWGS